MNRRISVGGLPRSATLMQSPLLCAPDGTVKSACVISSTIAVQPLGDGCVEASAADEAGKVRKALNGTQLEGQRLDVCSLPALSPC